MQCRIHIKEHLAPSWQHALGVDITHLVDGSSLLAGSLRDQAELFGVLWKLRSLNLTLLTLETGETLSQAAPSLEQEQDQAEETTS